MMKNAENQRIAPVSSMLKKLFKHSKKKARRKSNLVDLTITITRQQKAWLKEMKLKKVIPSYSGFIRILLDMYMNRRFAPIYMEAPRQVVRERKIVKIEEKISSIPVASNIDMETHRQLLSELKKVFKEKKLNVKT